MGQSFDNSSSTKREAFRGAIMGCLDHRLESRTRNALRFPDLGHSLVEKRGKASLAASKRATAGSRYLRRGLKG